MTDQQQKPRQYTRPGLGDLTANDLWVIKAATKVDLLSPPTVAHGDAALLWWASKSTDAPLVFQDLLALPLDQLGDLIADDEDEDEEQDEDAPDPTTVSEDDGPKASESSPSDSSDSRSEWAPPPPPSGNAPFTSSD